MTRAPTQYSRVPQQAQSGGLAILRLQAHALWRQQARRFAQQGLTHLRRRRPPDDVRRCLEQAGLTDEALSLCDGLPTALPVGSQYAWRGRPAELAPLAAAADDLASDSGQWQEQFAFLRELADQRAGDLLAECGSLVGRLLHSHGPAAARDALTLVAGALEQSRVQTRQELDDYRSKCWPAGRSPELRLVAESLRHAARPRGRLARLLGRLAPAFSGWVGLSEAQRAAIRRHLRTLNAAQADRYRLALPSARHQALDKLLGGAGRPGQLARLSAPVQAQEHCLENLSRLLGAIQRRPSRRRPVELLLVDSIETVIDPRTKRTLADLYDQRLRQAGYSSQDWADSLAADGLMIDGQVYLPHQWPELGPTALSASFFQSALQYLGLDHSQRDHQAASAEGAFQCLAGVTMLHQDLDSLLGQILPLVIARSKPYATVRPIPGAEPVDLVFLYCHPAQRAAWLEKFPYLKHADEASAAAYALSDPYTVILCQHQLAIAAGALHVFSGAMAKAAQGYKMHQITPFHDRRDYPEHRLLDSRPKDHDAARQLFDAAEKAWLVLPVGNPVTGYALTRPDPRLDHLFAPRTYAPAPSGADFFHQVLKANREFTVLVRASLPHLTDFLEIQERLADENDPGQVAAELVRLGILTRTPSGQYHMAFLPPADAIGVPLGLYTVQIGPTAGLPRDRFIAALQDHDLLYTVLCYGVRDAWQQGQLSDRDVPAFVRQFEDDE